MQVLGVRLWASLLRQGGQPLSQGGQLLFAKRPAPMARRLYPLKAASLFGSHWRDPRLFTLDGRHNVLQITRVLQLEGRHHHWAP